MNIDAEIRKYQEKIDELEKKKKELEILTPEQHLATVIHSKTCNWNHTDGCAWEYGSWEEPRSEHHYYLEKATNILQHVTLESALKVFSYL